MQNEGNNKYKKHRKSEDFRCFVADRLKNGKRLALGELRSTTCSLQTVLHEFLIEKTIGITQFFGLQFPFNPTLNPGGFVLICFLLIPCGRSRHLSECSINYGQ